jgi:hypothetical protein
MIVDFELDFLENAAKLVDSRLEPRTGKPARARIQIRLESSIKWSTSPDSASSHAKHAPRLK